MALLPCRECGRSISTDAAACPHCGARDPWQRTTASGDPSTSAISKRALLAVGAVALLAILYYGLSGRSEPAGPLQARGDSTLRAAMAYLTELPEVSWVQVEGRDVYIGWSIAPEDVGQVTVSAAVNGSQVVGGAVRVWSGLDVPIGWRPGSGGTFICDATAKDGYFQRESCRRPHTLPGPVPRP